jgi:ribosomal protein S18 acetylase RimI-like enzyme
MNAALLFSTLSNMASHRSVTTSHKDAAKQYAGLFPGSPFFDAWIPQSHFIDAEFDDAGNFTTCRQDNGIYGVALGPSPEIPKDWDRFSIESRAISSLPDEFKVVDAWDCYWASTVKGATYKPRVSTDQEIDEFLKLHAPSSSVFPGNKEILEWVEIKDSNQLVAVAALCRWESGKVIISSVATHTDFRGKGFGKALTEKCLNAGEKLGERYLCLGVHHTNESAQRLYQSTGFNLMHNFTYCERK